MEVLLWMTPISDILKVAVRTHDTASNGKEYIVINK